MSFSGRFCFLLHLLRLALLCHAQLDIVTELRSFQCKTEGRSLFRVMFWQCKAHIFSRASSVTFLVWAVWAVEKQTLFVCAVGTVWDLPQLVPRGRPWGKASCDRSDRNKDFQREGTQYHILLAIFAHLLKWLLEWCPWTLSFFHCCFWMRTFDLLSTDFFWRLLQRWALWFIFVQISWICTREFFVLFCFLACFPPEGNWQQQEQAHAEGAFVARHWKHKWPGCKSSKASSSMKKPCWRQTAGTARPFLPNL